MKRLIHIIAVISVIFFIASQSLNAQITIKVTLDGQCPDTCTSHEICTYKVEYQLYNICVEPPELCCTAPPQWVNCSTEEIYFDCDFSCDDPSNEKCYALVGIATKYCNGPGGNVAKCTGNGVHYYTCNELMTLPNVPVTVLW
ncbi:MAG TPA: hypothetical protein PLW31_12165 [Bacteroidales bacterium]|jgi:hypothetical protein|nr:hypothetical protein [Bacteroidales bacterium]MDX9906710.1 hypothetical protein [Bacteroidales bacterium]HNQ82749.1 hypothetical protein [Bacteroidales bacterium]HOX78776.1 hypothetical protein [Bacteroidales bacterium]HPI86694.1 hypothetical protein [Bacteroidales bacterium]